MEEVTVKPNRCPACNSTHIWKHGNVVNFKKGKKPRFICFDCGKTFY